MNLIVGCPPALPGSCYKCGSASRDRYVDLGMSVEFHGAMYLCDLCVEEMGSLVEMLSADKAKSLTLKNETAALRIDYLTHEVESLKVLSNAVDAVNSARTGNTEPALDGGLSGEEPPVGEEAGPADAPDGESGPAESSDDEGVDELRTSDSNQFAFTF